MRFRGRALFPAATVSASLAHFLTPPLSAFRIARASNFFPYHPPGVPDATAPSLNLRLVFPFPPASLQLSHPLPCPRDRAKTARKPRENHAYTRKPNPPSPISAARVRRNFLKYEPMLNSNSGPNDLPFRRIRTITTLLFRRTDTRRKVQSIPGKVVDGGSGSSWLRGNLAEEEKEREGMGAGFFGGCGEIIAVFGGAKREIP